MRVKMILPALTEATSPFFRPIKYSLFPPLGLATLAAYLTNDDEVEIQDEHVERLCLDDEPDLVVIQVYITSAYRAYQLAAHYRARGAYVVLGGLHVTSLPEEAAAHADTIFLGPGEDTWPQFLADYRRGEPQRLYRSTVRTLAGMPRIRRDLIKRRHYLVPNSIVVSRGCPHVCDFCYKEAFFEGGTSFYTQTVDEALAEIDRLPGRHLYFLDDHLFGNRRFATALFDGMRGMGRLWQAHPDAVSRNGALQADGRSGAHDRAELGSLRHAPYRIHPGADDAAAARGGLLARLSRFLPVEQHRPGRGCARRSRVRPPARGVCGGLEEAGADVGCDHPRPARDGNAAGARSHPERIRPPRIAVHRRPVPPGPGISKSSGVRGRAREPDRPT